MINKMEFFVIAVIYGITDGVLEYNFLTEKSVENATVKTAAKACFLFLI